MKPHCKRGHEMTEANTYVYTTKAGWSLNRCRACIKGWQRNFRRATTQRQLEARRAIRTELTEAQVKRLKSRIEDGVPLLEIAGMFNVGVDVVRKYQEAA